MFSFMLLSFVLRFSWGMLWLRSTLANAAWSHINWLHLWNRNEQSRMACNLKLDPSLAVRVCVKKTTGWVHIWNMRKINKLPHMANGSRYAATENSTSAGSTEKPINVQGLEGCEFDATSTFRMCRVHSAKVDLQMMANKYFNPSWCMYSDVIIWPEPALTRIGASQTSKVSNDFGKRIPNSILILKSKSRGWRRWFSVRTIFACSNSHRTLNEQCKHMQSNGVRSTKWLGKRIEMMK